MHVVETNSLQCEGHWRRRRARSRRCLAIAVAGAGTSRTPWAEGRGQFRDAATGGGGEFRRVVLRRPQQLPGWRRDRSPIHRYNGPSGRFAFRRRGIERRPGSLWPPPADFTERAFLALPLRKWGRSLRCRVFVRVFVIARRRIGSQILETAGLSAAYAHLRSLGPLVRHRSLTNDVLISTVVGAEAVCGRCALPTATGPIDRQGGSSLRIRPTIGARPIRALATEAA